MNSLQIKYPKHIDWTTLATTFSTDIPFSASIIDYLNQLSISLLRDSHSRAYPDVISFAFFCRKANIESLKQEYATKKGIKIGRGLLFHVAPSNVPVNFAYTLVAGLLCGNTNIVRVPSKSFPQVDIITSHIAGLSTHPVGKRIILVQYDRNSEATALFSSICNVRVIWGGDKTIAAIRNIPLPPRSTEVLFADRYSIAAIQADTLAKADDFTIAKLAEAFYNDTYLFDQNACSAPHLIAWQGNTSNIEMGKNRFWTAVQQIVEEKYNFQPIMAIDKLTALYKHAIAHNILKSTTSNNKLIRVQLTELPNDIEDYRCACGYFSETSIQSLSDLAPIITTKYQSLAYYGFTDDELQHFVLENHLKGLDRIVPFGQTTAFSLTWDGYNLYEYFTRDVSIL